jgi:mycoredoxin
MKQLIMYGANWCGDCRRAKRFLDENHVAYLEIDTEIDLLAIEKVKEINGGVGSIPVIIFPDGSHLTEPSNKELRAKLESLAIL